MSLRERGIPLQGFTVTGIGMASSLGDAITACAAARAGIVRPRPLHFTSGMDGTEPAYVTGHPCQPVDGFGGFGRLSYLAALALRDLFTRWSPKQLEPSRTVLVFNLPSAGERPVLDEYLGYLWAQGREAEEGEVLLRCLRPLVDTFLRGAPVHFLQSGHAGGLLAIEAAVQLLQTGRADACIICCVDSYLDLRTLEWLSATKRLKSAVNPVGLIPGEGAGAFVIEMAQAARRRGGEILADLETLGMAEEQWGYSDEAVVPRGEALSAALLQVVRADRAQALDAGMLLADLNGQTRRAMDWGHALIRCVDVEPTFRELEVWPLAASFGDVGSATSSFLVCYAVRAFVRQYSRGRELLLFSCSDTGQRAALALRRPG